MTKKKSKSNKQVAFQESADKTAASKPNKIFKEVEILKSLGVELPIGKKVSVEVDKSGVPLERFWRRRFSDMSKDECIKFVGDAPKAVAETKVNLISEDK